MWSSSFAELLLLDGLLRSLSSEASPKMEKIEMSREGRERRRSELTGSPLENSIQ
jgi:hypothetical protein